MSLCYIAVQHVTVKNVLSNIIQRTLSWPMSDISLSSANSTYRVCENVMLYSIMLYKDSHVFMSSPASAIVFGGSQSSWDDSQLKSTRWLLQEF